MKECLKEYYELELYLKIIELVSSMIWYLYIRLLQLK